MSAREEAGARAAAAPPVRGGGETRRLGIVGAALFALAASSYLLTELPLGGWALPLALAFAWAKATLIAWHFMELRTARTSVRAAVAIALLLLALLVGLSALDVGSRSPPPLLPPGRPALLGFS